MNRNNYFFALVMVVLALAAQPACAHTLAGTTGSLGSGLAHPFLGIDHLLAMLAVGLWAVQLSGSAPWKIPLAFVGTMLLASLMVALFALFHGHAHGSAMPVSASPLIYFAGFAAATLVLHVLGAASGHLLFQRSQAVLVRAGGMALAGAGLWLLIGM